MWFAALFTISKFLIFKSATDPISIKNSLSAEIGQVTNFRGLKLDRWPISVMEIRSLNQPSSLYYHPCFVVTKAENFDAFLMLVWSQADIEIWNMSQNEMQEMSHITRCVITHKYSFGMIEQLFTKNMRYIRK